MTSVYVTATGQLDNLGDSLLRRGYLDELRRAGELHVNLHGSSEDYISGLGLENGDTVYRSARAWEASLMKAAISGRRPVLALNAGEARITPAHAYIGARLAAVSALVRISRGCFVQAGLGVREAPELEPKSALMRSLRGAAVVTWRDSVSAASVGIGSVQPDWAFALEPMSKPASRELLLITMRMDRALPDEHWLRVVRKIASSNDLQYVLVSQVRRDNARLHEIATLLGCDGTVHEWRDDQDHGQRLALMAELYSRSRVVVSDRLHALILGAIHGAVPVGLTTGSAEKLRRTLAPARLEEWAFDASEAEAIDDLVLPDDSEILDRVAGARSDARRVGSAIRSRVSRSKAHNG